MDSVGPEDTRPPHPPTGYQDPVRIPDWEIRKQFLALLLFPVAHVLLWPDLFVSCIQLIGEDLRYFWVFMNYVDGQLVVVIVGVTIVHEIIHYALARRYGFAAVFGMNWLGAYVLIPRQFIDRGQYLRMVIAPLVMLTALAGLGIVLPLGSGAVVVSKLVLLLNTSMSSADILDFLLYRNQSGAAKFYNIPRGIYADTYVYDSASAVKHER